MSDLADKKQMDRLRQVREAMLAPAFGILATDYRSVSKMLGLVEFQSERAAPHAFNLPPPRSYSGTSPDDVAIWTDCVIAALEKVSGTTIDREAVLKVASELFRGAA